MDFEYSPKVLEARGRHEEAIKTNEKAIRLFADVGESGAEYTAALGQLADSHFYAGHYETADAINQRVLEANRRIYGTSHPKVADVTINLGASLFDRGRYTEAANLLRHALSMIEPHDESRSCLRRELLQATRALVQRN